MPDLTYTLTRTCLRSGEISLPYTMRTLFPDGDEVAVSDAARGESFTLRRVGPHRFGGLGPFLAAHALDVNDKILVRLGDDERLSFTPLPVVRRASNPARAGERLLELLYAANTPLSEAEIREWQPELSRSLELPGLLASDPRFALKEGRWRRAEAASPSPAASFVPSSAVRPDSADADSEGSPDTVPRRLRPTRDVERARPKLPSVTPYPHAVFFPREAGLNSEQASGDLSQLQRVKELFSALGFRVEGLPNAQALAHAELGRKTFSSLLHLLGDGPGEAKPDWQQLLSRRRELGATYLVVFGHDLDLAPLEKAAAGAQASLWSWAGFGRLETLLPLVPPSPLELEGYLERDGLYGKGLERFERLVQTRVEERGTFSAVLARLAALRAPSLFLLDDLTDAELSREQALRVLELLAQAPFQIVSKVGSGEFCLRFRVADGLSKFSDYALSLRERLPQRRTERLQALPSAGESGEPSNLAEPAPAALEPRQAPKASPRPVKRLGLIDDFSLSSEGPSDPARRR